MLARQRRGARGLGDCLALPLPPARGMALARGEGSEVAVAKGVLVAQGEGKGVSSSGKEEG